LIPLPWDKKRTIKEVPKETIDKAKKLGEIVRSKRIKKKADG